MSVLVVDAANVVGSRPEWRWWTDRGAAARRLHDAVAPLVGPSDTVLLVLEGQARQGLAASTTPHGVRVTHSNGSGDDEVVDVVAAARQTGEDCHVVTADRELVARVHALGASTRSPGSLWDRLEPDRRSDVAGGGPRHRATEHLT